MLKIHRNFPLLALSIAALFLGGLFLYRNSSSPLAVMMGVLLWFVGCAMVIAFCAIAIFREEERKAETRIPLSANFITARTGVHISAGHAGQVISNWLVPVIVALTFLAFVFGAAVFLLKS